MTAMVMSHTHTKGRGQRSLGSKLEWKPMDGQTDGRRQNDQRAPVTGTQWTILLLCAI